MFVLEIKIVFKVTAVAQDAHDDAPHQQRVVRVAKKNEEGVKGKTIDNAIEMAVN